MNHKLITLPMNKAETLTLIKSEYKNSSVAVVDIFVERQGNIQIVRPVVHVKNSSAFEDSANNRWPAILAYDIVGDSLKKRDLPPRQSQRVVESVDYSNITKQLEYFKEGMDSLLLKVNKGTVPSNAIQAAAWMNELAKPKTDSSFGRADVQFTARTDNQEEANVNGWRFLNQLSGLKIKEKPNLDFIETLARQYNTIPDVYFRTAVGSRTGRLFIKIKFGKSLLLWNIRFDLVWKAPD